MATEAQIDANRQNAQNSTGPRTEAGKAKSSRNHLLHGLYTRQDYVKPEERNLYKEFCETMYSELCPASLLEETLVSEITGASWRLRRCNAVEGELADYTTHDPMLDDSTEKTRRSIERARASAHSLLHRSINQLRKLQAERPARPAQDAPRPAPAETIEPDWKAIDLSIAAEKAGSASNCNIGVHPRESAANSASNCKPVARNAPCPCKSGEKFKRCCGRVGAGWPALSPQASVNGKSPMVDAPPVLGKAA